MDDESDFPDSGDLSTDDVMGVAQLTFPVPSEEVFGDVDVRLEPGWYALVFGSELFGNDGKGAALRNNPDIGDPSYFAYVSSRWRDLEGTSIPFDNHRFVVRGDVVPEPPTVVLSLFALLCLFIKRRNS